jgi:asparagine synthase (glutamine-hydrolysing)
MCGICGLVQRDQVPVDRQQLEAMNAALVHRGPDSDGYVLRPGVGLGVRRLAIIDLVTGDQPIANEAHTAWVVLNGEIYNFLSLRTNLKKRGHTFHTQTDTECLVHLYEEHGDECVQHLRGMYAFALWDEAQRRLLVARDRLGKKPLYYAERDGRLYFSSELPSLLQALCPRPALQLQALDLYLAMQYIPEPWTPFEGVHKLPAAHRLIWREGEVKVERYWELTALPKWQAADDDLAAQLREHVREAVNLRLISDVPLGAHLSGGIDSSIVVALMAERRSQPVKTFTVGFEEEAFSELPYARAVAERYATDHHEFVMSYGDVPATMRRLAAHLGEPFADPSALPLYHLSRLTREHVTVALNGDGGDDFFGGYPRYWLDPWANLYLRLPRLFTGGLMPALARRLPDRGDKPVGASVINGLKRLEQVGEVDRRASILRWGSYFSPTMRKRLWRETAAAQLNLRRPEEILATQFEAAPAHSFLDRTLYADISTYLPGDLLVKADRMTMACSLEGRSPLLDQEVVAWAARLPERLKARGLHGKHLLRRAFESYLPPLVRQRGKQGFGIPVGPWFRGPLADWSRETLLDPARPTAAWFHACEVERLLDEHRSRSADHGKRLWALMMLALWAEAFDIRG